MDRGSGDLYGLRRWRVPSHRQRVPPSDVGVYVPALRCPAPLAERDFARAQALRPWDADLPLMIAEAYAGAVSSHVETDADAATQWSNRAVELLPGSTRALKARGIIAFEGGDQGLARDSFERAARLSPTDPEVWHWLGGARLLGGDIEGAVTALERAHALDPEDVSIAETLAYARTGAS